MTPLRNPEAIQRLAALLRSLAERDQYKHVMHYSNLIATLQSLLDDLKVSKGTTAHWQINAAAVKSFNAARVYASEHGFDHPNAVMQSCGYDYAKIV